MKLGMVSLGCAKNKIDSELFLGCAVKYNIEITADVKEADIIVINTCGFIDSAKKESIDTILEMCDYKKDHKIIIAMGCLVERYYGELKELLPEVDYFIPIHKYNELDKLFKSLTSSEDIHYFDYKNRVLTTYNHSVYLRIGEGCNNRCSYCAIPLIRGNYVSRPASEIIDEAKWLASIGTKEITLIAQDTTRYGTDMKNSSYSLAKLIKEISTIEGIVWIRVLYLYVDEITPELLNEFKTNPKLVPYFDLPLQHSTDHMLKAMNRRGSRKDIDNLIKEIRSIPNSVLRTTLIVGFPGETDEDFDDLLKFVNETKFDRLGVFKYSDEEGTTGFDMKPKVKKSFMNYRLKEIMKAQSLISFEKNKSLIGKKIRVLIDNFDFDKNLYISRSYAYAMDDVDGYIYIKSDKPLMVGEFYDVNIIKADAYDLYAIVSK